MLHSHLTTLNAVSLMLITFRDQGLSSEALLAGSSIGAAERVALGHGLAPGVHLRGCGHAVEAGSRLRGVGMLSGGGMNREAAFGKLNALLVGAGLETAEVRRLVELDL